MAKWQAMKVVFGCRATARSRISTMPWWPDDAGLVVQPPRVGVHQAVVLGVHRQVHPVGVGHVDIHRHLQLGAFLQQGVHAGVVQVHAPGRGLAVEQPLALVPQFAHAAGAGLVAPLQFLDGRRTETRACRIRYSRTRTRPRSGRGTWRRAHRSCRTPGPSPSSSRSPSGPPSRPSCGPTCPPARASSRRHGRACRSRDTWPSAPSSAGPCRRTAGGSP